MLVIKFKYFDKSITWYIQNYYIYFLVSILGSLCGFFVVKIFKKLRIKRSNSKKYYQLTRGGSSLVPMGEVSSCVQENVPYLVKNKKIIDALKEVLGLKKLPKIVVIDRIVFLLSVLASNKLGILLKSNGIEILVDHGKTLLETNAKLFLSSLSMTILALAFSIPAIMKFLMVFSVPVFVPIYFWFKSLTFDCSPFVQKLQQAQVEQAVLYYIDQRDRDSDLVIMAPNDNQKIYKQYVDNQECNISNIDENHFSQTCQISNLDYELVEETVKTLNDVQNHDATKDIQLIKQYVKTPDDKAKINHRLEPYNKPKHSLKPRSKVKEMNEIYGPLEQRTQNLRGLNKNKENEHEVEKGIDESSGSQRAFNQKFAERVRRTRK